MRDGGHDHSREPADGGAAGQTPVSAPPRPRVRHWPHLLQLLILAAAVYYLLPQLTSLGHSMEVLRGMMWWAVGLAIAAQATSYAGSGFLVHATAGLVGQRVSIGTGAAVTLGSASIGLVAGGTLGAIAATHHWLRDRGVSAQGAWLASSLPAIFFNNALMFLAACIGLLHLAATHELTALEAVGFGLAAAFLVAVAGLFAWGVGHPEALARVAAKAGHRWARLRRRPFREEAVGEVLEPIWRAWGLFRSGGWHRPAAGAALNVGFDMLTLWLLFVAAGHPLGPGALLVGYGLPQLLARFTFIPGGIGVVEGSMAALYHGLGVPEGTSVVVIMGYRVLSFWLPTLIGFPVATILSRKRSEA